MKEPQQYLLKDNGTFPNSPLPVLHYKNVLSLPELIPCDHIRNVFGKHNWTNSWQSGVFTYHHYHSVTHEVMGVCKGKTELLLGGDDGMRVTIEKGDVLVIPAGVAHKNLGRENDVTCIGAYPDGREYDMNYGKPEERPAADKNIAAVPIPDTDPVAGADGPLVAVWHK